MARIRIVDEWLRSPVSAPARQRAIMVVARSWAEQRVLMRAFAMSDDQTRPVINLRGADLAIGPAGTDPHGEWGIHVEPPVDGRAQELREALQLAAKLLAGSKGNPARLQDEVPDFEGRATNMWAGKDRDGGQAATGVEASSGGAGYYEPAEAAPKSSSPVIPSSAAARAKKLAKTQFRRTPPFWSNTYETPELQQGTTTASREVLSSSSNHSAHGSNHSAHGSNHSAHGSNHSAHGSRRKKRQTFRYSGAMVAQTPQHSRPKKKAAKTVHGFSPASPSASTSGGYATIAGKTMPLGLTLEEPERAVLNALGQKPYLSAGEIGRLLGIEDPMSWMARFMDKLAELGLDLVTPGEDLDGEPTYVLPR